MKPSICGVLAFLLAALTIGGDCLADARDADDSPREVTVQIHDYVHLPPASLAAASDVVTGIYKSIGVRTDWLMPMRQEPFGGGSPSNHGAGSPSHGSPARSDPPYGPIAQLTIIVLTPAMTERGHIPEGILGFAAVAPGGGIGRIAYVVYDRVEQQASSGGIDETNLFGLVMAHEMGHLLLGPGSQSDSGLMKGYWDRDDLRRFRIITPQFSPREAEGIRAALGEPVSIARAKP